MGIKNLHSFLRRHSPDAYETIPLHHYSFRKIAIDTSIYMCKFKTSYGLQWLDGFLTFIEILRKNDVHPVFVFDTGFPPEKTLERKHRSDMRAKNRERFHYVKQQWRQQQRLGGSNDTTEEEEEKNMEKLLRDERVSSFFSRQLKIDLSKKPLDRKDIETEMWHFENTLLSVTPQDFQLLRELFEICSIPYIEAVEEAEGTCYLLMQQGHVDAVLTDDTDVLAYGCKTMLHRINLMNEHVVSLDLEKVLRELDFSFSQFQDFCIMCGTDYNHNLSKIGCERAYRLLLQYGNLETIQETFPSWDWEPLRFRRCRELFSPSSISVTTVSFTGFPDKDRLWKFCFENNCSVELFDRILRAFLWSRCHSFQKKEHHHDDDNDNDTMANSSRRLLKNESWFVV